MIKSHEVKPADRTPAEVAAEGMRADLLRNNGDHGCRVPVSEHLNAVTISGHVDLIALGRAALSALEKEGWVLVPKEPTQSMIERGDDANPTIWSEETPIGFGNDVASDVYRAMIAGSSYHGGKP